MADTDSFSGALAGEPLPSPPGPPLSGSHKRKRGETQKQRVLSCIFLPAQSATATQKTENRGAVVPRRHCATVLFSIASSRLVDGGNPLATMPTATASKGRQDCTILWREWRRLLRGWLFGLGHLKPRARKACGSSATARQPTAQGTRAHLLGS